MANTQAVATFGRYQVRPRGRKGGFAVWDTEYDMWATTAGTRDSAMETATVMDRYDRAGGKAAYDRQNTKGN